MSSDDRLIATRYVEALFELASESGQHDAVKADMLVVKSILQASVELQKFLVSPIVSREESAAAMAKLLAAAHASELTRQFFALLARNRRLSLTPLAIDKYLERLAESRDELTVDVTTAQALSEEEMQVLTNAISASTRKKVSLRARENAALLGGLQVRIGSTMLDNSVAGKLARLKQSLTQAA